MIKLTQNDWRIFRRLQRKHKVSTEFLRYNLVNIEKFIWFETWPRIVIKRYAIRKQNRVFLIYYRLRRVLFDQTNRKMFKRMRQNIKQWSKRIVGWRKLHNGIKEYVEEVMYEEKPMETSSNASEDVSKQLKVQLELLKAGRRPQSLIIDKKTANPQPPEEEDEQEVVEEEEVVENPSLNKPENQKSDSNINAEDVRKQLREQLNIIKARRNNTNATLDIIRPQDTSMETPQDWQINLESTPEKQITSQENIQPVKQLDTDEKTEKSLAETSIQQTEKLKTGLNFLDMLMCKVGGNSTNTAPATTSTNNTNSKTPASSKTKDNHLARMSSNSSLKEGYQHHHEHSLDSADEFLGFDDCERIPGMLMTPIVPHSTRNNKNSVFVSESLNEFMRLNDLERNYNIDNDKSVTRSKIYARDMEGLMTPKTTPPHFDMPAVPENLLKFRTVAERKQYLQKFSKNHRLTIINNEASIYRELQRRMRTQKVKSASQMLAQSANSAMSFTRNGWNAASFINTEFNKYYYQVLDVDYGAHKVRLRGARGNNDEFHKTPYVSRALKPPNECLEHCADEQVWQYLKPIKTIAAKTKKLNKDPLPAVFRPCPLSHKTFQKPLDDDTAALLLAGGSMAVVRMPTVELEVFPEYGKPLHEIAKRYLQYILPHHDISREWAEFSVSTLQQPKSLREAEQEAVKSLRARELRKSFTFVIPYLNDRNHILVRRVVDRSEKLDQSFEQTLEDRALVPKADFAFRQNLIDADEVLLTCADVVSDMINTVAISCSENSFIKNDPDGLMRDEVLAGQAVATKLHNKQLLNGGERRASASPSPINNSLVIGGNNKKPKKQNSLLMELKRLNATIIDAAVKTDSDKKPCCKEPCQMGCICESLEDITPLREHCGKTKCMFECTCKASNQGRIMRLETDGRTLTTEDAFMLRRKATARLARMEKEFTSTVVLTENETLLINETNNDKKRRCTKAPKRYEDFTDTEDEQRRISPKKTALTTIDKEKHLAIEIKEVHEPVCVKDIILEQLKHCTVNLVPLQDMDNIATWCMVHNLYKCFCKGRAVEGKPMIIEKEEVNTTTEHETEPKLECEYSAKAKYTFDKVEKRKKGVYYKETTEEQAMDYNEDDDDVKDNEAVPDYHDEELVAEQHGNEMTDKHDNAVEDHDRIGQRKRKKREPKATASEAEPDLVHEILDEYSQETSQEQNHINDKQKYKRSLHDVRHRFYQLRDDSCRRHIPTPRRMFLYCNRRRRLSILKYIKENESEQTRLLLNEHVMRSVYYHKIDTENHKRSIGAAAISLKEVGESKEKPANDSLSSNTEKAKKNYMLVNEVVDLIEDEDEPSTTPDLAKEKGENTQLNSTSSRPKSTTFEKILPDNETPDCSTNHFQICSSGGVITVKKFATLTDLKAMEQNKPSAPEITTTPATGATAAPEPTNQLVEELRIPKISSCFSLNANANANVQNPSTSAPQNQEQCLDFTSATSVNSAAFSQAQRQPPTASNNLAMGASTSSRDNRDNTCVLDMDNENIRDVYNSVIKTMNTLVSKKMQDIDCALHRESHIIPIPNSDILCIMKWCNFLDSFSKGFAFVWQVKMRWDDTFFVVTTRNVMPLIAGAMGIVNITALKADKMPLMGKMLLQKIRSKDTDTLAVVMQGKISYWVVKGFLKADPALACNKPTPDTHPSLTKKINVLCSLLVKQKQKEQKRKDRLQGVTWASPQMKAATQQSLNRTATPTATATTAAAVAAATATQTQNTPKIAQILPTRRTTTVAAPQQATLTPQPVLLTPQPQPAPTIAPPTVINAERPGNAKDYLQKQPDAVEPGTIIAKINARKRKVETTQSNNLLKMDTYSKMSSNIEFRNVTQSDINEIFLPELHKLDHKWLVLDLHNDFSHIFVPEFRDLVSLDRIQKVINFAQHKSKIVKLQFFQNAPFDAFVTPKSGRKIYFGPLTMDMKSPTLILLQSVDGQMMLRELYQLQHNIVKQPEEKTKAFWLIHFKGQTHFEMEVGGSNDKEKRGAHSVLPASSTTAVCLTTTGGNKQVVAACEPTTVATKVLNAELQNNKVVAECNEEQEEDDEDCMIIEDDEEMAESTAPSNKLLLNQSLLTPPAPIANRMSQSLLKVPNTNTIIKPLESSSSLPSPSTVMINVANSMSATSKPLPILTLPPNTIITGISPSAAAAPLQTTLNLAANAVVTSVKPAPPDAPYSSTIFITPSSNTTTITTSCNVTLTNNASTPATTTTITSLTNPRDCAAPIVPSPVNDLKSITLKKPTSLMRPSLQAGAIKRRRISLFCSNIYDKQTENLAVDAVIRKILPDTTEAIQINPLSSTQDAPLASTVAAAEVVATVGSTKISKIPQKEKYTLAANSPATAISATALNKTPIVFDVNFMDDGDEPTASIVIKPTTSSTATSATATTATAKVNATSTRTVVAKTNTTPTATTTASVAGNPLTGTVFKRITLPTATNSTKGTLINSLLCTKQSTVVPTFTTLKPIAPKVGGGGASAASSLLDSSITQLQYRKSSVSLKVQKIANSTALKTGKTGKTGKSLSGGGNQIVAASSTSSSTTTTTKANSSASPGMLTVKQVQELLNKSAVNEAPQPASAITSLSMLPPSIKATITAAKVTTGVSESVTPTALSQASLLTAKNTAAKIISAPNAVTPTTSPSCFSTASSSSQNTTLTISKVQSFGSPTKSIMPSQFTPPPSEIIIDDSNESISVPLAALPVSSSPPAHIQYGHIVSSSYMNQKFVAKRVTDEFYIKVPAVGILKLQGLEAVNNYLNKYISKTNKDALKKSSVWQFNASCKAVQLQNHQKSLLVRKNKTSPAKGAASGVTKTITQQSNDKMPVILIDD